MKDFWTSARCTIAAPFSTYYATRKRWLQEASDWKARGIAQADLARKSYVVPETGAVCITVSKCANTTVKFMLHDETMAVPRGVHREDHRLLRVSETGRTLGDLARGQSRIFSFVRHPVDRFWSGYFDKVVTRSAKSPINAALARHFGVAPKADFSPEMVLEYVQATSPVDLDEHLRPQWACTGAEYIPIDFIGKVERMKDDLETLVEIGFLTDAHLKRYGHLNEGKRKTSRSQHSALDPLVREIFARDMSLFGYE